MDTTGSPQLDIQGLAALVGLLLPILVAAITKKYSSPLVKSLANIVLVVIASVVVVYTQDEDGHVGFYQVANALIITFTASVVSYKGLWKSVNISNIAPNSGIGAPVRQVEQPGAYDTQRTQHPTGE